MQCLILSYMNILKIDNLVGFDKLVKLQLDNNIIEKVENLGHLSSLEVCFYSRCLPNFIQYATNTAGSGPIFQQYY